MIEKFDFTMVIFIHCLNVVLIQVASLGGFILYVGFLAFNGGSQLWITSPNDDQAASIAVMSTILGGATSAIVTMILCKATGAIRKQDHYWSLLMTINGGLAGK